MRKLQKTMRIKYAIIMIILVISLIALRLSMANYHVIQQYKSTFEQIKQLEKEDYEKIL